MTATQEEVSTFARMVDKLRKMDEAELKLAYIKLFEDEISEKWKKLVDEINFGNVADEEITNAFTEQRYSSKA